MCTFSSLYLHIIYPSPPPPPPWSLHDILCLIYLFPFHSYFVSCIIIPSTLVHVFVVLSYSSSPYTMRYKAVVYYMYIDSNISVCLSVCLSPSLSPFSPSLSLPSLPLPPSPSLSLPSLPLPPFLLPILSPSFFLSSSFSLASSLCVCFWLYYMLCVCPWHQ